MASVQSLNTVQQMYIAYYQRPGDPSGLLYWANRLEAPGGSVQQIQDAFGNSAESQALYGPINSTTIGDVVDEIYLGLFGRLPDAAGKQFYVDQFNAGLISASGIASSVLFGAQNNDAVIVQNKLLAANNFSEIVDGRPFVDPQFGQGAFFNATYGGTADASAARAWLGAIDANPVTIPSPSQTTSFIQSSIANPGDPITGTTGGTFHTLTTSTDVIQITNPASVDTVLGIVSTTPTFSVGDLIIGNNQTTLKLTVVNGGNAALATLANIHAVNLVAGANTNVYFDGIGWTNVGSVNLVGGTNGMFAEVDNLAPSTGFSISSAITGSIELNYTNHINVYGSSEAGGALSYEPNTGAVIGSAGPGGDVSFEAWTSDGLAGDLNIGNVSLVGNGSDYGGFSAYHTRTGDGGDLTVGDVSITGFNYIYVDVSVSDYTGDSHNLTIGNVTELTSGGGADAYLYLGNENYQSDGVPAGDLTAGNLLQTGGKGAYLYMDIWDSGYGGAGDVTIGNITQTVGQSGDAYLYLDHSGDWNTAGDDITVGTTTIGNIAMTVGVGGYGYVDLYNWVSASAAAATLSQVTVGNVDMNLNVDSTGYFYLSVSASATGGGVSTIEGVTLGNFTANVNDGGYLYGYPLYVYNSSTGGSIGDVQAGNLTVVAGVSATVTLYNDITAWRSGDSIGNFTQGDVTITANTGADVWVSDYLYATNGDIGDVKIGNISVSAAKSATAEFGLYEYGNNVGDWDIGNVSIVANGLNAFASVSMSWTATDSMGPSDVGNVTMLVKGESADGYYYFYESAGSAGTATFGNFDLSVGNSAKKLGAYLDVYISNTVSDVVIGDVKLVGSSVRGTTDITQTYQAHFTAYAGSDLKIGNIAVSGGDGKADNFATLTTWLNATAGGTVTIGDVDYSGYGAKATIDVSGYKGAPNIKGSSKADTITDNKGTNSITGGAGADAFHFVTTNTGKTLATMDKLTDFTEASGDLIYTGFGPITVAQYGEGDYATFSAFASAADSGNKVVWVGNITGTGLVAAVDWNADNTVDYMIQLVGLNNLNQIDVNAFG